MEYLLRLQILINKKLKWGGLWGVGTDKDRVDHAGPLHSNLNIDVYFLGIKQCEV